MGRERLAAITVTRRTGARGTNAQNFAVILSNESPNASFGSDKMKRYGINSSSSVGLDWGTSSETYKAFIRMSQQRPKPAYVYISKRTAAVATVKTLTETGDLLSGQTIVGSVNGEAISVPFDTNDATSLANLDTAISAVQGVAGVTVSGKILTITATAEYPLSVGTFTVTGSGTKPTFAVATTTAGRTIADDISELLAQSNIPYLIYPTSTSTGVILAASADVEGRQKLLFAQTTAADVPTSATDDIASQLKALAYTRTALFYTEDSTGHYPAGLAAIMLGYDAGGVQAVNRRVIGATPDPLTDDEIGYLEEKYCNSFTYIDNNIAAVQMGVCVDGIDIHATRDTDHLVDILFGRIANTLTVNPKIAINKKGLGLIEADGLSTTQYGLDKDILDPDYENFFQAPEPEDIPDEDKAANLASGFEGDWKIQKAMARVAISLSVSV
jgi:hypothetical protein